jgi:methyl-accepting chemotaxis protein
MKIKTQILVFIFAATVLIVGLSIGYVSEYTKNVAIEDAQRISDGYAREYANRIKSELDADMGICRALAAAVTSHNDLDVEQKKSMYNRIILNTYTQNPQYLALWCSFELNTFDPNYYKSHGRWRSTVHEFNGKIIQTLDSMDMDKDNVDGLYYGIKITRKEAVTIPYYYAYDKRVKEVLVASICAPMQIDGKFAGIAGIDRILESFQDSVSQIKPYPDSYAFLISSNGSFISHPDKSRIGKRISEIDAAYDEKFNITQNIKNGISFSTIVDDPENGKIYISYAPFLIGRSTTPWAIGIAVPYDQIIAGANQNYRISLIIGIISILLLSIIIFLVTNKISKSLVQTIRILDKLSEGDLNKALKLKIKSDKDEIGQIKRSVNHLIDGLNATTEFAIKIGQGDYVSDFKPQSENDVLGNALLEMRQNLIKVRDEAAIRVSEDDKRNWVTSGLAGLSEILRENWGNMEDFSFNILQSMIKYVGANQGGLFIINNDKPEEPYIEQIATYAYDRKKILQKKLNLNAGLIGRCIKEKTTIHLRDIPENYIIITSGLGYSTPRNILLIPLVFNKEVFGVIEIASFETFAPHHIQFMERIAETIASAVSNMKISLKTGELLEESNKKSEELAVQEREMRESVSQLQAAQAESKYREAEMNGIIDALTSTSSIVHMDPNGFILAINQSQNEASQLYSSDAIGRNHKEYAVESVSDPQGFKHFWESLRQGERKTRNVHVLNDFEDKWIAETYTPVLDSNGMVTKVLVFQTNITEAKKQEIAISNQTQELYEQENSLKTSMQQYEASQREILAKTERIEALNRAVDIGLMRGEMDTEGVFHFINPNYAETLGYRPEEVVGKHLNLFIASEDTYETQKIWKILLSGRTYKGEVRRITKKGEVKWFLMSYIPEINHVGVVIKILFLGYDINESKRLTNELNEKAKLLEAKEQELNKTIDELQTKQDEIIKKNYEIESLNNVVDKTILRAEFSPYGTFIDVNLLFLNTLGYDRDEILSKSFFQLVSDEEREDFKMFWKNVLREGSFRGNIHLQAKNKDLLSFNASLLTETSNGRVTKIYLLCSDNTEEKRLQKEISGQAKELKESEQRLKLMVELLQSKQDKIISKDATKGDILEAINSNFYIVEFDIKGNIVFVNAKFAHLIHKEIDELIGHQVFDVFSQNLALAEKYKKAIFAVEAQRKQQNLVSAFEFEGKTMTLNESFTPVFNDKEVVYKVINIAIDITEALKTA